MGRILFRKDHGYAEGGITTDVYSCDQWQIMPTEHEFRIATEIKEVASNDWLDEDGDDEFVPDKPCFKAFEDEIEFVYKGEDPVGMIGDFIYYLSHGGVFAMYDEHSGIGYQECRFVKYDPEADYIREGKEAVVRFKVTFKINTPQTRVVLTK